MHLGKKSSSDSKKYPPGSFMGRLRERKIIATLAAFIGGGWLTYEVVHWILVDHYHLPKTLKDVTIVTFLGALLGTVIWCWFRGAEKRPGNIKVEVLVVPLIILLTLVIDLKFIFVMTDLSINMLLIGIVALCLGIAWVVFKSLQWAASAPETEKKAEDLKPIEEKPISFPKTKCSIVVLPFVDMSPDRKNEYFSDGLTEEVITDLSQIHELCVISRNSAMTLKGTDKNTKTIGEELNVQYVLEGSVRKAGNNLRIAAQLIDANTDIHLWAEKYSGTLDDVFDIQEKVSRSIVDTLKVKLSPAENERISEHLIENIQAYEYYLKARHEIMLFTEEGFDLAIGHLHEGLRILGENALLLRGIGFARFQQLNIGVSSDRTLITEIEEYAERILKWNSESPHGFFLHGCAAVLKGDFLEAVKQWRRAFNIDPYDPDTLLFLGAHSLSTGQPEFARKLFDRLVTIDPLAPINHMLISYSDFYRGRPGDNLESLRRAVKTGSDVPIVMLCAVRIFAAAGEMDEASSVAEQLKNKHPITMFSQSANALILALQGNKGEALDQLTNDLLELVLHDCEWATSLIECYSIIGENEKALELLEHSVNGGLINYPFLNEYDPFFENIRGEPRFKKLMERVKHEWENFEV